MGGFSCQDLKVRTETLVIAAVGSYKGGVCGGCQFLFLFKALIRCLLAGQTIGNLMKGGDNFFMPEAKFFIKYGFGLSISDSVI